MEVIRSEGLCFRCLSAHDLDRHLDEKRLTVVLKVCPRFIAEALSTAPRLADIASDNFVCFDTAGTRRRIARGADRQLGSTLLSLEMMPLIFEGARDRKLRVFLLGGPRGTNDALQDALSQRYGIEIEGYAPVVEPYPFEPETNTAILDRIEQVCPDILIVGMGRGNQESWLDDHRAPLRRLGVRLAFSIGTLEYLDRGRTGRPWHHRLTKALRHHSRRSDDYRTSEL